MYTLKLIEHSHTFMHTVQLSQIQQIDSLEQTISFLVLTQPSFKGVGDT